MIEWESKWWMYADNIIERADISTHIGSEKIVSVDFRVCEHCGSWHFGGGTTKRYWFVENPNNSLLQVLRTRTQQPDNKRYFFKAILQQTKTNCKMYGLWVQRWSADYNV